MKQAKITWLGALGLGAALLCPPSLFGADEKPAAPPPPRSTGQAGGQRGAGVTQRNQEFLKKMAEELKLTDEQKKKVEANQKAMAEKAMKLREDTSLSPEDRRAKSRTIREEGDKKMKEILSAEQFEKWQKLREEQAQTMRQRGGQGGGQRGGQRGGQGNNPNAQ